MKVEISLIVHRCQHQRMKKRDFARVTITRDIFIPGPYVALSKSPLNKQTKHTKFNKFAERISFAEHWRLVAESSEFHFTASRAHLERIFSNSEYAKKAGHFK